MPAPAVAGALGGRLTVRDTGVGIPADQQAAVFEPFVQVAAPTTRTQGGTGPGLSIVRQLAQLLGGEVQLAERVVGRGSTFVVELPALAEGRREAERSGRDQPERASRDLATT